MTSAEYLDIRVKMESMQNRLNQASMDINIIKCLLITEFAQKRGIDAQELMTQLYDVYNKHFEEGSSDDKT